MDYTKEFNNHKDKLVNKTILCYCEDSSKYNFSEYLATNFNSLNLKGLIAVIPPNSTKLSSTFSLIDYDKSKYYLLDFSNLSSIDSSDNISLDTIKTYLTNSSYITSISKKEYNKVLKGILEITDLVVCNPSFAGFHLYFKELMESATDFLILCNSNLALHKSIFPYIKNGWVNLNLINKKDNFCWLSTFSLSNEDKTLPLKREYSPDKYQKYDDYNALYLNRIVNIPKDYSGLIGVPLSFLFKWNSKQFKIIDRVQCHKGKKSLPRLIIKHVTNL